MSRKFEAIDLMDIYVRGNNKAWNRMLLKHVRDKNINGLGKVLYQIQAGMDDLAKKKLNDEKINLWYFRLVKSIEQTAREIIAIRHPMPQDNPLIAGEYPEFTEIKRKRNQDLANFLKLSSY